MPVLVRGCVKGKADNLARCKRIDFTAWVPEGDDKHGRVQVPAIDGSVKNEDDWRNVVGNYFDRWAYGREFAPETGRPHYQCRGYLKNDLDANTTLALAHFGCCNITPTHVKDFEYIYKDGDYWRSWDLWRPEYTWIEEHWDVWMTELEGMNDDKGRSIEIICDPEGNHGKTAFAMYMAFIRHKATYCPVCEKGQDLINFVLQAETSSWYIVDTPRAFEFTKSWATAIEQLKNGYVYDHRYNYREKILPCRPRVTILCNEVPEYEKYFSKDRVLSLEITEKGYLWQGV